MASSRSMNRPRRRDRGRGRPPLRTGPPLPPPRPRNVSNLPLEPNTATLILLGLLGAEGIAQCAVERARVAGELEHRLAWEREHFPDNEDGSSRWEERALVWQPVSCAVSFEADSGPGFVMAPVVTITAQLGPATLRSVRFSVCAMNRIRITTVNWHAELQRVFLPKQPTDMAEAMETAARVIGRAMVPLLAFVDPLKE